MRLPFLLFLFFLMSFSPSRGQRQHILIDKDWKFSQSDTVDAISSNFNDAGWRTLDLPHDWSIEGEFSEKAATGGGGGYLPTGIGWYRKHLTVTEAELHRYVSIRFDGVYQNSDVWINGHHLGHYPSGYNSFEYTLTPYLQKGNNVIVVRVDNSLQPNTRWYSGSGIYRHVWLNMTAPVHLAAGKTFITTTRADQNMAGIHVQTVIENPGDKTSTSTLLRCILLNPHGVEVTRTDIPAPLNTGGATQLNIDMNIANPLLWSLEDCNLYLLRTQVVENGTVVDETSTAFGIRTIAYDTNKGFFLNGKHIKMNGVCIHHDAGSVGAAVPEAMWVRRLNILKEMGCNAIRTSHNAVAPELLDLCDKMGFLVMDEFVDEWTSPKVKYGYSNYFRDWSQHDLVNFIHRDRNHPSIVMWSAGNEIGEQKQNNGHEILRALMETFHREDPTRPVTTGNDNIAADGGSAKLPFLDLLDIVGYNYVDRWHERRELFYDIDRHDHPGWKMVGTESVSIPGVRGNYYGGSFFGIDSSVIRPANMAGVNRAEQLWKYVAIHDFVIGDFMWTGIDYLGEARWPNKNASSGVIDLCGFPKDAYYFYQSQWTTAPMIHIVPHWNWKGHEKQVIPVLVYTNCDSVELFLNGRSFGLKALEFPRQGNSGSWNRYDRPLVNTTTGDLHLSWDVPYEPGTLRAVGHKGGRTAVIQEMQTTGPPAALRLSTDQHGIDNGVYDIYHIKVEVVDAEGRVVPESNNEVQLSVTGGAKLIGFDNGNPVDHTSMRSSAHKVFNGLALAVIRSTGGGFELTATSPGLQAAKKNL